MRLICFWGKPVFEIAPNHLADNIIDGDGCGIVSAHILPVSKDGNFISNLLNFFHFMGNVDDCRAVIA